MGTKATIDERDRRIALLRAAMVAHDLDALLVAGKGHWWTGRGYLRYLTDFHLWGHDGLLLLPLDREPVLALTSPAVGRRVAARGWIDDVRGDVRLVPAIADACREAGLTGGRIGVAGYDWILPVGRFDALREALPDVELVHADRAVNAVREIKSPLEIEQSRELWSVMRAAMAAFEEGLEPGLTQRQATARAVEAAHALGARDVLIFIGEDPRDMNPPTATTLRCDGVLRLHLEICGESGHWCERTMMYAFRDQTDREHALQEAEIAAFDALRAFARPGRTLAAVAAAYEAALGDAGFPVTEPSAHFDFHGQGLDAIEYPLFSSADPAGTNPDAELREGQVFSYHPARPVAPSEVWGPDIHDNIVIRPDGAERLSGSWDLRWKRL